jgi:hypothetical protein
MVTLSSSTMTGTSRRPLLYASIRWRSAALFLTSKYSTVQPRCAKASRASDVYGQVSLPKIRTVGIGDSSCAGSEDPASIRHAPRRV